MKTHYTNLIVGGGPAGLYMAWRLSQNNLNDTAIFEWSPVRLGGRIYTKKFGEDERKPFLEFGGMRFSSKHKILEELISQLNLTKNKKEFKMTEDRLYYIRGEHINQSEITKKGVPYKTTRSTWLPDHLFKYISNEIIGNNIPKTRAAWFDFFDNAVIPKCFKSNIYKENNFLRNIGYWNLMLDQLDNEAFQYAADAGGYTSNIINSNAAYAIYSNSDFDTTEKYYRLDEGFSLLFNTLEEKCINKNVDINKGQRLTKFNWNSNDKKFYCEFIEYDKDNNPCDIPRQITCDKLMLCMPRHSLELIQENDVVGIWPQNKPRKILKNRKIQYYIESVIQQPSYKIGLIYQDPWWEESYYLPSLSKRLSNEDNYGPTITDLPLRQIYYFGDNRPTRKQPLYGLLASYDDMWYTKFWQGLESDKTVLKPESEDLQPLGMCKPVPNIMLEMIRKQLNEIHFNDSELKVPEPIFGYYMNWGLNPPCAGYHAWKPNYILADAQYYMTRPSEVIDENVPLYIAGSAYSSDQAWVEGAFCTAETILVDKFNLDPIINIEEYPLICRPK